MRYECIADLNLTSQITLITFHWFLCVIWAKPLYNFFNLYIWKRHRSLKWLKGPKMAILVPWAGLVTSNWWKSVEQIWNKSGPIWGAALESFHLSRVTMLQRAKKQFVAIYGSGGFKVVEQAVWNKVGTSLGTPSSMWSNHFLGQECPLGST